MGCRGLLRSSHNTTPKLISAENNAGKKIPAAGREHCVSFQPLHCHAHNKQWFSIGKVVFKLFFKIIFSGLFFPTRMFIRQIKEPDSPDPTDAVLGENSLWWSSKKMN